MIDIDTAVIRGAYSLDDGWHLSRERVLALCDEIDRLRDRLAEVEDDHSRMVEWHDQQHARAEAAEAKLAAVEAEMNAYANAYVEANKRLAAAEAEIEFMRAWCADHFGGLMPPTREQNAALMKALDEMEDPRD